jgi:hypothetical protein
MAYAYNSHAKGKKYSQDFDGESSRKRSFRRSIKGEEDKINV